MDRASGKRPSSRWHQLVEDVFEVGEQTGEAWPDPAYAEAAAACGSDRVALEKLHRLCEDLESVVSLAPGPCSFVRLARVPADVLSGLDGRCWREVLLDKHLSKTTWEGLCHYGLALQGSAMDPVSRRTGAVIHAIAVRRLERLGHAPKGAEAQKHAATRAALLEKPYLIRPLRELLR